VLLDLEKFVLLLLLLFAFLGVARLLDGDQLLVAFLLEPLYFLNQLVDLLSEVLDFGAGGVLLFFVLAPLGLALGLFVCLDFDVHVLGCLLVDFFLLLQILHVLFQLNEFLFVVFFSGVEDAVVFCIHGLVLHFMGGPQFVDAVFLLAGLLLGVHFVAHLLCILLLDFFVLAFEFVVEPLLLRLEVAQSVPVGLLVLNLLVEVEDGGVGGEQFVEKPL